MIAVTIASTVRTRMSLHFHQNAISGILAGMRIIAEYDPLGRTWNAFYEGHPEAAFGGPTELTAVRRLVLYDWPAGFDFSNVTADDSISTVHRKIYGRGASGASLSRVRRGRAVCRAERGARVPGLSWSESTIRPNSSRQ